MLLVFQYNLITFLRIQVLIRSYLFRRKQVQQKDNNIINKNYVTHVHNSICFYQLVYWFAANFLHPCE